MKNFKICVLLAIAASLVHSAKDFEHFNTAHNQKFLDANVQGDDDYYAKMLTSCFKGFGELAIIKPADRAEENFRQKKYALEVKMINEIAKLLIIMGLYKDMEPYYALVFVKAYQVVPYHNVCHGISVALFAASIDISKNQADGLQGAAVITKDTKNVFLAGLLHDIGHPGYTNTAFGNLAANSAKSFSFFKKEPITFKETYTDDADGQQKQRDVPVTQCDVNDELFENMQQNAYLKQIDQLLRRTLTHGSQAFDLKGAFAYGLRHARLAAFTKFTFTPKPYFTPELETEWKNIYNSVEVESVKDAQLKAKLDHAIDEHPALKVSCGSAELVQAILAFYILNYEKPDELLGDIDEYFVLRSILATNMSNYAAADKVEPVNVKESYVHAADLMGNIAWNADFRKEMLKQLFVEFIQESFFKTVLFVGIDYDAALPTAQGKVEANKHPDNNGNAVLNEATFIAKQKGFLEFVIKNHLDHIKDIPLMGQNDGYLKNLSDIKNAFGNTEFTEIQTSLANARSFGKDNFFRRVI